MAPAFRCEALQGLSEWRVDQFVIPARPDPERLAALPPRFITRFAPAPTGHLHLGHAVSAVYVWGIAGLLGGRVLLRIEDHDRTRSRAEFESSILDDLDWLGLIPDGGTTAEFRAGTHAQRQSDSAARYSQALELLDGAQRVYPCNCSRREIAQDVPDRFGEELRYPGRCGARAINPESTPARRVILDTRDEAFDDVRLGPQVQRPSEQCGDLLARDRLGQWTYQFAVTVDDLEQGVNVVIRGEDLLSSVGRQLALARMLGRTEPMRFLHHPLIRHPDGAKLSKSNRDTGLRDLRAAGCSAEEVLGRAAFLGGLQAEDRPVASHELKGLFGS